MPKSSCYGTSWPSRAGRWRAPRCRGRSADSPPSPRPAARDDGHSADGPALAPAAGDPSLDLWVPRMSSGLCDLRIRVLVNQAAEPGPGAGPQPLRPVGVVMIYVDGDYVFELAAVDDQDPVEELTA